MLTAYQQQFNALIQAPSSPKPLITADAATVYINTARGQVAGEAGCIRVYATLEITPASQQYPFSAIVFPAGTQGVQGVFNVRLGNYVVASGYQLLRPRPWEWYHSYILSQPVSTAGPPKVFAQYGQGALGTLWFNLSDSDYTVNLDTVCYPVPLVNDATFEALPYLWTDAVPYYAAWLGMMNEQRQGDADKMMERYRDLMQRARQAATPTLLPGLYQGGADPFLANRLGLSQGRGGGQAGAA